MLSNQDSPLHKAIEAITIPEAWYRLRKPGEPKKLCCSPLRNDRKPSFSIYNDDRLFKDFGTGDKGDVVTFVSIAAGIDKSEACKLLIEWNGGKVSYQSSRSSQRPVWASQHVRKHAEKNRKELVIPPLDRGSIDELTKLRVSRELPCFVPMELLFQRKHSF